MTEPVDRIDLKMLRALQKDGRISNAELAQAVDVSAATCHRRTQRLRALTGRLLPSRDGRAGAVPGGVAQ